MKKSQKGVKPVDLYFLLIATIIVIPLIFSTKTLDPNLSPRLLVLGIVIFVLLIINIIKSINSRPQVDFVKLIIFPLFLLYFLWSVFSLTQAINPSEGLFDLTKTFLSIALLIFATQVFLQYKNSISILVKFVILSSIIATSIGLYQYFNKVPGNLGYDLLLALYEIKGLMAHKNQYAISLFLMLPFVLYGVFNFKKWWWGISLYSTLIILLNITILQTRSVWIATLTFLVCFILLWLIVRLKNRLIVHSGLLKRGGVIAIILIIVATCSFIVFQKSGTSELMKKQVSSIFDTESENNLGRLKMWESTWQLSQDHLFFGVGAGNWKITVLPYYNLNYGSKYQNWRRPHNDFLWVLSEKGMIGLLFYLLLFLIIATYSMKVIFKETDKLKLILTSLLISGIGGYLVIAFVTFPLERINHQVFVMMMMAGIISIYYKHPENPKPKKNKSYIRIHMLALIITTSVIFYAGILIRSEFYVQRLYDATKTKDWKLIIQHADNAFTKFTTIDSYSMPIHNYKGIANLKLKRHKQASKDFLIALGYFPTQITILNNLGTISSMSGDYKTAIKYFKQSTELFPQYNVSLLNLAKTYHKNNEHEKAYIALLNCHSKNTRADYKEFMRKLKKRINKPIH